MCTVSVHDIAMQLGNRSNVTIIIGYLLSLIAYTETNFIVSEFEMMWVYLLTKNQISLEP